MTLGFVHACEQNHLHLSTVGGGQVVQLASGKVVTSALDPFPVYNYTFGVRRRLDLDGAARAFRAAGRDRVNVLVSPSSHAGLRDELGRLGFRLQWEDARRRTTGTGAGAPGLLPLGPADFDGFLDAWKAAWGGCHGTEGREEAFHRRFHDGRSRPWRSADGAGVFVLFDSGPTTQLLHLAVAAPAQGRGLGRRMLGLARGVVSAGRPLWLATEIGDQGDRAAAAAGWELDHTTAICTLDLDDHHPPPPEPGT
jgi:GNAT superfamily N-acetyltransferase